MNEKLVEQVARALAVADRIQICSDASYAQSSYRSKSQAAIAAHSAFIREAAEVREAVAKALESGGADNSPGWWLRQADNAINAMLDQIERTQNDA